MRNYYLLFFLLLIFQSTVNAQNGKIIEQIPYTIADTSMAQIEKRLPNAKALINAVDFFKITYLSDGLKVNGFMSVPKKSGKFPALFLTEVATEITAAQLISHLSDFLQRCRVGIM